MPVTSFPRLGVGKLFLEGLDSKYLGFVGQKAKWKILGKNLYNHLKCNHLKMKKKIIISQVIQKLGAGQIRLAILPPPGLDILYTHTWITHHTNVFKYVSHVELALCAAMFFEVILLTTFQLEGK